MFFIIMFLLGVLFVIGGTIGLAFTNSDSWYIVYIIGIMIILVALFIELGSKP